MATTEDNNDIKVDETPISPLERKNSLEQYLQHRPERQELVERNILPASTAAPGLQAQQRELQKHMRADSLNEKIAHRPPPEEVIQKHILHEDPRTAEEKYAEAIEDEYAKREGGA
ncbi:putative rpel repeat protein [Podospora fimiseda]|uniref:Rpel repeat protein n=1 Tax=Podospora fimiseda TaxID=252190 RepID=A0AAN7H668_9PEZI|nr:putative rpel repeat protein [Podospora fimiseda]